MTNFGGLHEEATNKPANTSGIHGTAMVYDQGGWEGKAWFMVGGK